MKTNKLAAVLLILTLSLGASQGALAHHDTTCVSALNDLRGAIADTNSFVSNGRHGETARDKTRLLDKADEALFKLGFHKPADALKKVGNIRDKMVELRDARKTKIDYGDANNILTEVAKAESCLNAII